MNQFNIHISEDHDIYIDGLVHLLEKIKNIKITHISKTGRDTIYALNTDPPDLLLLDLNLPDMMGTEIIDFIKKNNLKTKIIIVSMHYDKSFVNLAKKRGADGYVPKNAAKELLLDAISGVLHEKLDFEPAKRKHNAKNEIFSTRELEILEYLKIGKNSEEIANVLSISIHTVKTHRKNIFKKTSAKSIVELLRYLALNGIIN